MNVAYPTETGKWFFGVRSGRNRLQILAFFVQMGHSRPICEPTHRRGSPDFLSFLMSCSFYPFDTTMARNYDQANFPLRSSFLQSEFFPRRI